MSEGFHTLEAQGIRTTLDLRAGHIRRLEIQIDGTTITPLHTASWVDDPQITEDKSIPLNLRCLSGDFFCAPFAASDVEESPPHGWPANSTWSVIDIKSHPRGGAIARYELERRVIGAKLIKELILCDGHPFLYERHIFVGGHGSLPVANHAMTNFPSGGRLFFSQKAHGETRTVPLETDPARGRSHLRHPTRFIDLTRVEAADGTLADLTHYPFARRHEDFVMLVEAPGSPLGWAAALRPGQDDMFLSLKNPATFPVTMLWFSNGGRDYAPWNGRHIGVLGIEEGRSYSAYGHKASIEPNPLSSAGIPTALDLKPGGEVEVRNVIGGLPLMGLTAIKSVMAQPETLVLEDASGALRKVPYDTQFLAEAS